MQYFIGIMRSALSDIEIDRVRGETILKELGFSEAQFLKSYFEVLTFESAASESVLAKGLMS